MKLFILTIILILSFVVCHAQNSKTETLTNKMVVSLVKAKFSADTIIKKIQTAASVSFDTGTDALIELKNSGVEEKIITAMLDRVAINAPVKTGNSDGAGGTGTSVSVSTSQEKEKPKKFSAKAKYFTFDLSECKAAGDTITCEFLITNNDKTAQREIYYPYGSMATIINEKGKQFKSYNKEIGGQRESRQPLAFDIPISGSVTFDGIKDTITTIKLLTLPFAYPSNARKDVTKPNPDFFQIEFRDVPVTQ